MSSSGIAAGVPVFSRDEALQRFLESVPAYVSTVYVADNGADKDRDSYHEDWPFTLDAIELPYDAGIGACRAAITVACTEPYLWMGDCDMEFVREDDLTTLRDVLDAHPGLGGVSGWLVEDRAVRAGARDLHVYDDIAIKEASGHGPPETDPVPFYRFEFIPQAGLFRTEIYTDYNYDPDIGASEHFDFFYAHKQLGNWEFASTPAVVVRHNRNINPEYRASDRGGNHADYDTIEEKWGVKRSLPGAKMDWAQVHDQGVKADAFDLVKQLTPPHVWVPLRRGLKAVGVT